MRSTNEAWKASIIALLLGFMIAASSPASMAMVRKLAFITSLAGRPKEMLLTPRTVVRPRRSFTSLIAFSVSLALSGAALTVIARQSTMRSSLRKPAFNALSSIFSATLSLPSAVSGMPSSSRVRPRTAAPYSAASGRMDVSFFSSPLIEFISGLPSTALSPASTASGLDESITIGRLEFPFTANTAEPIAKTSSMPGTPTLTSRAFAPAVSCCLASFLIPAVLPSFISCARTFLPVGFILSPIIMGERPAPNNVTELLEESAVNPAFLPAAGVIPLNASPIIFICSAEYPYPGLDEPGDISRHLLRRGREYRLGALQNRDTGVWLRDKGQRAYLRDSGNGLAYPLYAQRAVCAYDICA